MKTVLILVLSADFSHYERMIHTSQRTWDSVKLEGVETVYYCGLKGNTNIPKVVYLPIDESLLNMGHKTIMAFEWALQNKEFDYLARVHSSTYVDKNNLIEYVQSLPNENVFAGVEALSQNGFQFCWGGGHYLVSRDVLQKIVDNKGKWRHEVMEDESMSLVVSGLGIPFTAGKSGAIDKMEEGWQCISYGGESITFHDFAELKRLKHHYFRIKQDGKRYLEEFLMEEMFRVLK